MVDDIVARLRLRTDPSQMLMCDPPRPAPDMLCCEAAAEIEQVRAELVVAERNVTFYYYKWKYEIEKNAKLSNVLHHLSKLQDVQKYQNVGFEELTNYVQKIARVALEGEKKDD